MPILASSAHDRRDPAFRRGLDAELAAMENFLT